MSVVSLRRCVFAGLLVLMLSLVVTACGSSSDSSSSESTTAAETDSNEAGNGGEGGAPDMAAVKQELAPYIGQPSPFPVTEKLKEIPKGATVDYVDCGSPICALYYELMTPAAAELEIKLNRIKAGTAANTVAAAFDTVLAQKPDAVIVGSIELPLWAQPLKELQEAEIPVVTSGITNIEEAGVVSPQLSNHASEVAGKLLADYAVTEMGGGDKTDAVFYETPELSFTTVAAEAFNQQFEAICPGCPVRTAKIGVEEFGSTAPNTVVSDLQAHPDTTLAVFGAASGIEGLPAAMQAAGIEIETLGYAPAPAELQYLKEGKQTAALGYDTPVAALNLIDMAVRQIVGQKLAGPQAEGLPVNQFLVQSDITFDPSHGWTGYPDFEERFAKLWGVTG